ncbi:MAG: hypothetical protein U5K31_05540 [Balneolaceae bacterium]|nr:hypothetical protein [Balneolaceae bacterium]
MPDKPQYRSGYSSETTDALRQLCLLVATRIGDLMPRIRVVGGRVPALLINPRLPDEKEIHIGTTDLDLGIELAVLEKKYYQEISKRLRQAGLQNDVTETGNPTRQRWTTPSNELTIDFLIPPASGEDEAGTLQDLEGDFAAVVTPGLEFAFRDFAVLELEGKTPEGDHATRRIWVCGPGAFVILKSLALHSRGEPKDAYDLHYTLAHWPDGLDDIVERIDKLPKNEIIREAIEYLESDFSAIDSIGPQKVDRFLGGEEADDEELRADVSGLVLEFCRRIS